MSSFGILFVRFGFPFFRWIHRPPWTSQTRSLVELLCTGLPASRSNWTNWGIEDCDVNVPRTRTSCSSEVVTWLSGLFLYVFICFYFESTRLKMALATNWRLLLEHEIPVDVRTKENWARIIFGCLLIHPKDHWTLKTGVILRTQTTLLSYTGSNPSIGGSFGSLGQHFNSGSRPSNFLARMTLLHSSLLLGVAMCQYVNGCSLRRLA